MGAMIDDLAMPLLCTVDYRAAPAFTKAGTRSPSCPRTFQVAVKRQILIGSAPADGAWVACSDKMPGQFPRSRSQQRAY
jgi:hypothetical protein